MADTTEQAFLSKGRKIFLVAEIAVTTLNQNNGWKDFTLSDTNIEKVLKISVTCDIAVQGFYRTTFGFKVGGEEVLPENYELRNMMTGIECPPEERMMSIDRKAGNNTVSVNLRDADHSEAPFTPYVVRVYALCELKNQ
jgi:hypothetical protein